MTVALLRYRPPTPDALQAVVLHDRREELKKRHLGNLVWHIARFLYPDHGISSFSDYANRLEKDPHGNSTTSNDAVVQAAENMLLTFLPKRGERYGDEAL